MRFSLVAAWLLLLAGVGCAPIPASRYVPLANTVDVVYSDCAFNTHVPVGVRLPVGAAMATVAINTYRSRQYLELRLDVPTGTTLRFASAALQISGPAASSVSNFRSISLVDSPVRRLDGGPPNRENDLAIHELMQGGEVGPPSMRTSRHFWVVAPIEAAAELHVRLPPLIENGTVVHDLQAHFRRQVVVGFALVNC